MLDPDDTIAALASPPGPGFRGLARLSGPRAWSIALDTFEADHDAPPPRFAAIRPGRLRVDGLRSTLPAMLALWPGPRTYTGQPLAEIHTVGSPPLLQFVLAHALARGARAAEPGEFTLRAFLSGRLDLTRAEAVLGVIDARSPAQLDAALGQLAGGLASPIARLRDRLLDVLAHLEAGLDFVDEADVDPLARHALADELTAGAAEVASLADRMRDRDRPALTPTVVLAGPPNVGKSRLFNALLGRETALVSPIAGTTRDYLGAPCDCDGLLVELVDTAGIEPAACPIQGRAQDFRDQQTRLADLVLDCRLAADLPPTASPPADPQPRLIVWTQVDRAEPPHLGPDALPTSALTGQGVANLRRAIARQIRSRNAADDADPVLGTGPRCRNALSQANQALLAAAEAVTLGAGDELVAIDLRRAADALGRVVGAVVTDDILDRIFRRFCIGK